MRAVVFAERVATLNWLHEHLPGRPRPHRRAVGRPARRPAPTSSSRRSSTASSRSTSPIRVLVTGDVASEGVNLHAQCHQLIHYDIPWSLIRIEQRNGRIDRYGQRHRRRSPPCCSTRTTEPFSGDVRVLSRLIEKEHEAHTALGDVASLMGKYDVKGEEDEIREVLAGQATLDDVVRTPARCWPPTTLSPGCFARLVDARPTRHRSPRPAASRSAADVAVPRRRSPSSTTRCTRPSSTPTARRSPRAASAGGTTAASASSELVPPPDLRQRLDVLPQTLSGRRQGHRAAQARHHHGPGQGPARRTRSATTSAPPGRRRTTSGPLHPVLDWAADRALASLGRNQVFAVRGDVDEPTVLLLGTLTNRRGPGRLGVVLADRRVPRSPTTRRSASVTPHESAAVALAAAVGFDTGGQPGRGRRSRRAATR